MNIVKELPSIALNITEPEYRAMPELSYSTLSTYEKVGFNGLEHLFDKKESPSLLLGSLVDCLITGTQEEFDSLYTILDVNVTDGGKDVCNQLIRMDLHYFTFTEIPEDIVSNAAKEVGFWKADKWDKIRYREVLKTGNIADYYDALLNSDKTVVDSKMYEDALNCVKALKSSPATKGYFAENNPFSSVQRYYQLKFRADLDGVGYRCMADLLAVDYEKKVVYPIDLKTSSASEWDFEKSFLSWHYYIQARLYWRIIRANMDNDPYFKDFKLEDYRFIVVNKFTLTPLVWLFPLTKEMGTLVTDEGEEIRDPYEIGKELRHYLDNRPEVPDGINKDGLNTITCLHKKDSLND